MKKSSFMKTFAQFVFMRHRYSDGENILLTGHPNNGAELSTYGGYNEIKT